LKTDSLFYRLFHEIPAIVLQLAGQSPLEAEREAERYVFRSVELKQTAFRIDGVLLPRDDEQAPVWFVEVQFQPDEMLYHRLFSELLLFVRQNPTTHDWRVLLLFPRRSLEPQQVDLHRELLGSDRVFRVYIEDLPAIADLPLEIALVKLITEPQNRAVESGRNLLQRALTPKLCYPDQVHEENLAK
jgi:predicted transposase/invertase (TIGR01784 family)